MSIFQKYSSLYTRPNIANIFMVLFIIGTTVGTSMLFLPAGLIVGGIACGLYGYLLGSN